MSPAEKKNAKESTANKMNPELTSAETNRAAEPAPDNLNADVNPMVNLAAVDRPRKNLAEAALIVHWKGYLGDATYRAGQLWDGLSRDLLDKAQLPYANVHEVTGTTDFALTPAKRQSSGSLQFRYPPDKDFRVNLGKVLALAEITVPKGYRLIIPVDRTNLPGVGECLVLLLTKRRLEKIGSKNKPAESVDDSPAAS